MDTLATIAAALGCDARDLLTPAVKGKKGEVMPLVTVLLDAACVSVIMAVPLVCWIVLHRWQKEVMRREQEEARGFPIKLGGSNEK